MWVHCGYPCTFWSPLAHCTRTRNDVKQRKNKVAGIGVYFCSKQVAKWQRDMGRHVSTENPPRCLSWKLDVVLELVSSCQLKCVDMDFCMWGAREPGNMLAYKKPMRLANDVDLTPLIRTCNRQHLHQVWKAACVVQWRSQRHEEKHNFWRIPNGIM